MGFFVVKIFICFKQPTHTKLKIFHTKFKSFLRILIKFQFFHTIFKIFTLKLKLLALFLKSQRNKWVNPFILRSQ